LQFKELKDKIDSNKGTYLHLQIQERVVSKEKLDKEIAGHEEKIKASEVQIEELKHKVEENKEKQQQINREIEQKGEG